jgi:hypothetical protein
VFFGLLSVYSPRYSYWDKKITKECWRIQRGTYGILTLGIGLGDSAVLGTLINMLGHSLTKAGLSFVAGDIFYYFRYKKISAITGSDRRHTSFRDTLDNRILTDNGNSPFGYIPWEIPYLKRGAVPGPLRRGHGLLNCSGCSLYRMARIFISMTQGAPQEHMKPKYKGTMIF